MTIRTTSAVHRAPHQGPQQGRRYRHVGRAAGPLPNDKRKVRKSVHTPGNNRAVLDGGGPARGRLLNHHHNVAARNRKPARACAHPFNATSSRWSSICPRSKITCANR